jgi:hypothetical protein
MSTDELVLQLVVALAAKQGHSEAYLVGHPTLAALYRADASVCVPVVVAFAAEWLEGQQAELLAAQWQQEMT